MERFNLRLLVISLSLINISSYAAGYFQSHNLMSQATKNIPNQWLMNDNTINLEAREKNTGHVVNTLFANDGGMAGCGVTSTLMQYMYQNRGTADFSKNYIALNVYSQIPGFDPNAPFWGTGEGQLKGYLTQGSSPLNVQYPFTPYHRVIPSLYPAYLGLYNNGLNCGRFVQADLALQNCLDRTTPAGVSKFCPSGVFSYTGQRMFGYVFDSCEDNNGWCRDDEAHIDINQSAVTNAANYYLQWRFISNPYYSDNNAPSFLKDIWLAWFSQASPYWSYIAVLNAENGISQLQYNIGSMTQPTWINSHVLAGDNNITWRSTSNNGQLWQIEPINALTDTGPASNPFYQIRFFDHLGYPAQNGMIYQFHLLFEDGSLGQQVNGYYFFYQGGLAVKAGPQMQNMQLIKRPSGLGTILLNFDQLIPNQFSLDKGSSNYLRPVLISNDGFTWDPDACVNHICTFTNLPTGSQFHLFANGINEVSNDLTLRKSNHIQFSSDSLSFQSGTTSLSYTVKINDRNLSVLYSARVTIPLKFATDNIAPVNANLQALFIPNDSLNQSKNIKANVQACFLNNYIKTIVDPNQVVPNYLGNDSTCTIYYTAEHLSSFDLPSPSASFNVLLPKAVGIGDNSFNLASPYQIPIDILGYTPNNLPVTKRLALANYLKADTTIPRSLFFILDPESDVICLNHLDPQLGIQITVANATSNLTQINLPIEIPINQNISAIGTKVNLDANSNVSCNAMLAIVPSVSQPLVPGLDVIEVLKLIAAPQAVIPVIKQGIAAKAVGSIECLGNSDNLNFMANGNLAASVPYQLSATTSNVNVAVPAGTYTITDKTFTVPGGSCQLIETPIVTIQNDTYVPVNLNYLFTASASNNCTVIPNVVSNWPGGCVINFTLASTQPLSHVNLSWKRGLYDWSHVTVWGGQGNLNVPTDPLANVIWILPSWVNGQGQTVGMNVNNDNNPLICTAFANGLTANCSGLTSRHKFKSFSGISH